MMLIGYYVTRFDDIYPDIFNASIDLLSDKVGRNFVNGVDALCILCSQRGLRSHGIAAMSCDDL